MDCIFNKYIPETTPNVVILRPTSKTWVNGLSQSYDETFPQELERILDKQEFRASISEINNTLYDYWPCFLCFNFGYFFCLCTVGLSFCPSLLCVNDARSQVDSVIEKINQRFYHQNVRWTLRTKCSTSWIEILIKS